MQITALQDLRITLENNARGSFIAFKVFVAISDTVIRASVRCSISIPNITHSFLPQYTLKVPLSDFFVEKTVTLKL